MSNVQSIVSSTSAQGMIGQTVTIRFADESEKTGKIGAYDSVKQLIRIDWHKNAHFWIPSVATTGITIRKAAENIY
jgi:hypothetical protein